MGKDRNKIGSWYAPGKDGEGSKRFRLKSKAAAWAQKVANQTGQQTAIAFVPGRPSSLYYKTGGGGGYSNEYFSPKEKYNSLRKIAKKSMTVRNPSSVTIRQAPDGRVLVTVKRKGKRR